jgi:hypothetical protein
MDLTRKLPIGIRTFEEVRRNGYLYVDKTAMVWQIANMGKLYFLSRPRKFGKSLLLSTFKAYFEGKRDLFEGLALEQLETEWTDYPVLHLDLNAKKYSTLKRLDVIIDSHLVQWEKLYGKNESENSFSTRFAGIIRRAYEQTGKEVVVLIDEYDEPLLHMLMNKKLSAAYKQTLKSFYDVLKSANRFLRFVLLTGVTKQISVLGGLNRLKDISMKPRYITICGITKEELIESFTPELTTLAESNRWSFEDAVVKMNAMYDGYHFHPQSKSMLNPFDVLNALEFRKIDYYWLDTGVPAYLVKFLDRSNYDLFRLSDGVQVGVDAFAEYWAEPGNPLPVIYQYGYLTIKAYNKNFKRYTLGFPNDEVRFGFENFLTYMVVSKTLAVINGNQSTESIVSPQSERDEDSEE